MNIYSVLDDSENEEEVTKVVAPKKEKDVPISKKEQSVKKETTSKPTKSVDASDEVKSKAKQTENKSKDQKPLLPTSNSFADLEVSGKEDTRGGRGRGKDKGGRGSKAGRVKGEATGGDEEIAKKVKHEGFDRRDGSGRGNGRSKGGRGSYGAGNVFQEALEGEKDPKAVIQENSVAEEDETEVVAESEVVPVEPEVVTYTLDEFMKQRDETRQKAIAAGLASKEAVRKVDAVVEFAGLTLKEKSTLVDYLPDVYSKSEVVGKKDQRSTGKAVILDVGFKSAQPQQQSESRENRDRSTTSRGSGRRDGGGGRFGGRGSGGGGRTGGGSRSSGPSTVFNVMDFPSL